MKNTFQRLVSWFFEKGDPAVAASLRIGYGLIYLFMLWDLYPMLDLLLGHAGLYGSIEKQYINFAHPFSLLYRFDLPGPLRIWFWGSVVAWF